MEITDRGDETGYTAPVLTEDERREILFRWNETEAPCPNDVTLHRLFEEQASATPDHFAVFCQEESLTYGELNRRANCLAHAIRGFHRTLYKEDILPDTPIGICLNRGVGALVAILGILKAGCAYLPLDPEYPAERLRFMMDDALAPLVVTEAALLEKLLFLNESDYGVISLDGGRDVISKYPDSNPEPISGPDNLAYIIYTSGSTGKAKGTLIEHKNAVNYACSKIKELQIVPGDRVLSLSSLNFDASVSDIFPTLLSGASLYIALNEIRKDPEAIVRSLRENSITRIMMVTPAALHAMPMEELPALKTVMVGGEVCAAETLKFWSRGRTLINVYGPTECTVISHGCIYREGMPDTEIGRSIDNVTSYILDSRLNPVPAGMTGELHIGGAGICRGYLNRPELTAERFIKNPFATSEEKAAGRNLRLYKTGDLARWLPEGSIEYMGRVDFQVKIRGFRIEPEEIKAALFTHGEIKDCAVAPYEEAGEKRLAAYYVPISGSTPSAVNLRAHLAEVLPDYMIPSAFVKMESLPLSPSGKIDLKALPAPTPDLMFAGLTTAVPFRGPETPEEEEVSWIIASIMNRKQVSTDDDIFDLGVHSLMAARIASEIRKECFVKVELKDIFENRTIRSLAELVTKRRSGVQEELVSIPRISHRKNIPLTFQQEQIWFLSKLVPDNRAYNSQFIVEFKGKLDKELLKRCLNEIIRRHEILRTTFHENVNGPIQIVHSPWKASVPKIDLSSLPETVRREEAEKQINSVFAQSFDFSRLPLVKWRLYKLGEEEYVFLHMEHHFIHDGWGVAVFLNELKTLYASFKDGKESPLEKIPIQYADYAVWQRYYLAGERLEEKLLYWENRLKDYPQILSLTTDYPRPYVQSLNGGAIRFDIERRLYHSLREFARNHKITLFTVMYSAFALLVSKYSRQKRFLIGTGVANRTIRETEPMMGMFVNMVLLYSDLTDNPTFLDLLQTTKEAMLLDSAHYDIPFMHIVKRLKAGNVPGRNPMFQVIFAFHDSAVPLLDFADLKGRLIERHNSTAKTDMNVICIPRAEQHVAGSMGHPESEDLTILWEYNSDLFDRETIQRMLDHYLVLLAALLDSPETRARDAGLLSSSEKDTLLQDLNNNAIPYDREQTMMELFAEQVAFRPDKIALVHNGRSYTYRELDVEAERMACWLKRTYESPAGSLAPGTPIGICVRRGHEMMIGILGILKAGGAYVPLPPNYPEERLRFIMRDAGIKVVLTQADLERGLPILAADGRKVLHLDAEPEGRGEDDEAFLPNSCGPEDIAYIIYTSGSTGIPKGVCIPHRAVNNLVASLKKDIFTGDEIIAQISTYAFDASVYEFWGALLTGGTLVIIDNEKIEDLRLFKEEIVNNGVTSSWFTTALFNAIVDCEPAILWPLRSVLFGGETANEGSVRKLLAEKPDTLKVFHGYGPTECTCFSTYCQLTDRLTERGVIPIGKPLHNYIAYVLDEGMRPLPKGIPGELYIGGDSLAKGYLNRPEFTAERFIENPFATAQERERGVNTRIYKTGDLVRWLPDDNIEFLGRTDFQVKIRGFRIEPEEIEAVLLKHPAVKQTVVIPWEQHLIAYWTPRDSSSAISVDDLKSFLSSRLPNFMIPETFIRLESFALTNNFKVDRSKLPTPKQEDLLDAAREYIAPATKTEEILAEIWKKLLHINRIGVNDNFFEIGGNSILTVRMLSSVKRKLGVEVNIAQMFEQPTIASLGAHIDGTGITSGLVENNLSLALKDAQTEITVAYTSKGNWCDPAAVLLTGVTGFLGLYLLDSLLAETAADVYCLIRGESSMAVEERFVHTLAFYRKEHLRNHPRIKLLRGDLGEKGLGLPPDTLAMLKEQMDSIYHCGAFVHHLYDYKALRKINISGSLDLLQLAASGREKSFNFISTLGSASLRDGEGRLLEIDPDDMPVSTNGYILGKWVMERILGRVASKGLICNIFRPGNITGDSVTGVCPAEKNHSLLFLKGCIQMTAAPDWKRSMEMTPVDVLSRAVVRLSFGAEGFSTYNMNNPNELSWHDYIGLIRDYGFNLDLVPHTIWKEKYLARIDEGNSLYPLKEFYLKERKDLLFRNWKSFSRWNSSEVREKLQQLGISYPDNYRDYTRAIIDHLVNTGFIRTY